MKGITMINDKVSIIVLTYRKFDNLKKNILSIITQDYQNYEVIIHDDGSDNFDLEYIDQMIPKEYRNKFFVKTSEKNQGTVRNFNHAIQLSSGQIIMPLSQDDVFANTHVIRDVVYTFDKTQCDACLGKRKGAITSSIYPSDRDFNLIDNDYKVLKKRLQFENFISGSSLYYRKSSLQKLKYFDEKYVYLEDYPLVMKLLRSNMKISGLDEVTVIYGENGVTNENNNSSVHRQLVRDNITNYKTNVQPDLNTRLLIDKYIDYTKLFIGNDSLLQKCLINLRHPIMACLKLWLKKHRTKGNASILNESEDFFNLLELERRRNKRASN